MKAELLFICSVILLSTSCSQKENPSKSQQSSIPTEQIGSNEDRAITKEIRQSLMENNTFSVKAQNISIKTENSTVTLRGQVENEEEKRTIEKIASATQGVKKVDNHLEISKKESENK